MFTDNIEKLYQNYGILADAKDNISKHEKEYLEILAAVKGSDKEKRLASQFIAKFFNSFPNRADQAIQALFDLCEDYDIAIRKQAIKDLPTLCKDHKENIQRIVKTLAQRLTTDDTTESNFVTNSLLSILKIDAICALRGLFSQIHQDSDTKVTNEVVRKRCIKFLVSKVEHLGGEVINEEAEDLIISECNKVLEVKEQSHSEDKRQSRGQKRHRPITFDNEHDKMSPEKRSRSGDRNLKIYTPPCGKYNSRHNNKGRFSGSNSGRGVKGGYGRHDFINNGAPFRRRNN